MPAKSSIGGTAVQLVAAATNARRGVQLKADPANTGKVYVGYSNAVTAGSADATDGMVLAAGEAYFVPPVKIPSQDASNLWLIGSAANQKVFYDVIDL